MKTWTFDSWGLGTQSTYMIVAEILGLIDFDPPDAIIFSDTQWELKASYEIRDFYKKWFEDHGIPVISNTAGNIRELGAKTHIHIPFFTQDGGPLRRQCTRYFKIDVAKKTMRKFAGFHSTKPPHPKPGQFINRMGYSIDEWGRMSDEGPKYIRKEYPLIHHKIHRWESIEAFDKLGLPVPVRSACIGCPYRSASGWQEMKEKWPDEFDDAIRFDKENRHNPLAESGVETSALFIWRGLIPLDEVDFEEEAKKERQGDQVHMFGCVDGCWT